MRVEIDQSGKIEQTSKTTVVAYANGSVRSLQISGREKQLLVQIMRAAKFPKKTYVYTIFGALAFLLIKDARVRLEIVIDMEYVGHETTIKNVILQLCWKFGTIPPDASFDTIGKESNAHKEAIAVFRRRKKADRVVEAREVWNLFAHKNKPRKTGLT